MLLEVWESGMVYGAGKNADTEMLIVIDNSGSMKKSMDFLKKVVSMIELLADGCEEDINISYLIFNEQAQITGEFGEIQIISGKETCIMQGIEAADQWMEKKIEKGNIVKVLFISDLFSSRYLENGQVKKYDMDYALKEQKKILEIEKKWKEWCDNKKANILIWTWESFCATEKKVNTVDYLQKNNIDEASWGYQVKFEPVKNTIISANCPEETDQNAEFIKQTVQSFEILQGAPDVKWESYKVNNEKEREVKVGDEEKQIYLFFPDVTDIQVEYDGVEVGSQYDGLYLLDQKKDVYKVKAQSNAGIKDGYKLIVPEIEWKISFSNGTLKRNEEFTVFLTPSAPLSGNGSNLEDGCILKILKGKEEVCRCNMEFDAEKNCFYAECEIEAGAYTFIALVNGIEVDKEGRSVN